MQRHEREYERNPTDSLIRGWGRIWKVQKRVAEFFGANATDFFLRPNVSLAMNDFIQGVPIAKGGEILTTNLEYGAILNQIRFRAERDGIPVRVVELPGVSDVAPVERIVASIRPETRAVVVSHVMTGTGLVVPIRELARETRKRGILLIVDGAHAPGALDLDFKLLDDVDFYGGNLHKWMMGPKGTGFGWVHPRNQAGFHPVVAGWTSFEPLPQFQEFGDGNTFALRMLGSSSQNFAPYFALEELIALWEEWGKEAVFARIGELQAVVEDEVRKQLGWPLISPPLGSSLRGPLSTFDPPDSVAQEGWGFMFRALEQAKVQVMTPVVERKNRLRLSPHIYNTEQQIRDGISALHRVASSR